MIGFLRRLFSRPLKRASPTVPFKDQVDECGKRYVDLVCTWRIFKDLYFDGNWGLVLQHIAPETFHEIARSLTEHTILQLCRLTDVVKFEGELPLSIKRINSGALVYADGNDIFGRLEYEADGVTAKIFPQRQRKKKFKQELKNAYEALRPISKKLYVHRNKKIAHHDFRAAFDPASNVLPNVSYMELGDAVEKIGIFLQVINSHLWGTGVTFNYPYVRKPDELVDILAQALEKQIRPRQR